MKTIRPLRRALAIGAGLALSAGVIAPSFAASSGTVQSQALTPTAKSALDWIEKELIANGDHLKSGFVDTEHDNQFVSFDDPGLTVDALLALYAGGRSTGTETGKTKTWVLDHATTYINNNTVGDKAVGAMAKLLVMANAFKITGNIGGLDLATDLQARESTTGPQAGRFKDVVTDTQFGDDFSNTIGQSLAMIGLKGAGKAVDQKAIDWLLAQQCTNGGFRLFTDEGTSCAADTDASLDATSFAELALLETANLEHDDEEAAVTSGLAFMLSKQSSTDGGFAGNANSTGLAASVFRAVGLVPQANKAAGFIKSIQLTDANTAALAKADIGAIAVDVPTFTVAKTAGLTPQTHTTFDRATAQGVLALGLGSYIDLDTPPVEPTSTAAVSAASVPLGGSVTVSGTGFQGNEVVSVVLHSDPITVGTPTADIHGNVSFTFVVPAAAGVGAHTIDLTGGTSHVTVSVPITLTAAVVATTTTTTVAGATTTTTTPHLLARTGSSTTNQWQLALALLAAGGALVLIAYRRRIIYPFKK